MLNLRNSGMGSLQRGKPSHHSHHPLHAHITKSIKRPEKVVKFAASALCSEKPEGVPRLAGCFPLGAGKIFDACTKQPAQKKP